MEWWLDYLRLKEKVLGWLESMRFKGGPAWGLYKPDAHYPYPWEIESTVTAVKILEDFGEFDKVPPADRQGLGRYLCSLQDPESGMVIDPNVPRDKWPKGNGTDCWDHSTGMVINTLPMLGAQLSRPVKKTGDPSPMSREQIVAWLEARSWKQNAWGAGGVVGQLMARHRAAVGMLNSDREDDFMNTVYDWLEANQDPTTGLWGPDRGGEVYRAMCGLHCVSIGTYYKPGRPLPRPERVIDSTLSLQVADGWFYGDGACIGFDATLALCNAARFTDYRRTDILAALDRLVKCILSRSWQPDGGFSNYEHGGTRDDKGCAIPGRKPVGDIRATYMYPVVMKRYSLLKRGIPFEVQAM